MLQRRRVVVRKENEINHIPKLWFPRGIMISASPQGLYVHLLVLVQDHRAYRHPHTTLNYETTLIDCLNYLNPRVFSYSYPFSTLLLVPTMSVFHSRGYTFQILPPETLRMVFPKTDRRFQFFQIAVGFIIKVPLMMASFLQNLVKCNISYMQ